MTATKSLVTGAGGFVGEHLVRRLHARGDTVIASDVRDRTDLPVKMSVADLTDAAQMAPLLEGVDVVFHNASVVQTARAGADRVWAVNLGGTKTMLEAAKKAGVKRFVYVSSASVVYQGTDLENGAEDLPYAATSQAPYADSKIAAEKEVLAANAPGFLTSSIRPHVIFGPGDTRFLPNILVRADAGRMKVGIGREAHLSDFTYIDNLIDALILADEVLARDPSIGGRAYFVTNGEPTPFWEFVDRVLVARGDPKIQYRLPYWFAYSAAAMVEWSRALTGRANAPEDGFTRFAVRYMCTHHYFSIERAKKDLGYVPKVSIDEGIKRTVAARAARA
ncbi:MAG: NAD-dependent epimerase/dehydratase family protein [Deltaproteobacteria bacterium]|nr:NAD-dependent epimerase/dehydratase family protein [Deltaproteobacteria bacterium]